MEKTTTRILLIEGSPDDASVIKYLLAGDEAGQSYEVKDALRLAAGSDLISRDAFDAALVNLALPAGNGLEAFGRLRRQRPDLPIVAMIPPGDERLGREALTIGAQEFLVKGALDKAQLRRSIRYAMERKRSMKELESLLLGDPSGKVVVDGKEIVRFVNPAAERVLQAPAEALLGKPIHPPAKAPGASEIPFDTRIDPITWNGEPSRVMTFHDARRLESLKAEIASSQRTVELTNQFLHRVSHELRNPLTVVKTAMSCLKSGMAGSPSAQQLKFIDMASRNVDRQIRMLDDLLDLARIQSGSTKVDARDVDLRELLSEIVEEYQFVGTHKLDVDLAPGLPRVTGDPDLIAQVVRNLLDNALRFARQHVLVQSSPAARGEVLVNVIDDGSGIPKDRVAEVFDQFVQINRPSGGKAYKGTGLGLAICKEIVERHGGRIWVENSAGKGCRFSFLLPSVGARNPPVSTAGSSRMAAADAPRR
ncbi:MAG: response regulator [Elusimicrobia bacterium]|nr:response regulator [Elusimicrobiota bacterium]